MPSPRLSRYWIWGGVSVVVAACIGLFQLNQQSADQLVAEAQAAIRMGKLSVASQNLQRLLRREPRHAHALFLTGTIAVRERRVTDAIAAFGQAAEFGSAETAVNSLEQLAVLLLETKRPFPAEQAFRRLLSLQPDNPRARFELSFLLCATGRGWEARNLLLSGLQEGDVPIDHLLWMCGPEFLLNQTAGELLATWEAASPEDPLPPLGRAAIAGRTQHWSDSERLARESIKREASLNAAHAELGRALFEQRREEAYADWVRVLPANAADSPDIWLSRGLWAEHFGQLQAAVRCFGECVRLNPDDSTATYRLARLFRDLKEPLWAERFELRTKLLRQFSDVGVLVSRQRFDLQKLTQAGELAERLGRKWEAVGWYRQALRLDGTQIELADRWKRLRATLKPGGTPTDVDDVPTRDIDLSRWPIPDLPETTAVPQVIAANPPVVCRTRFREATADSGVGFHYFNGADPAIGRVYMFEFSGGGIAALDFDGDLWPDLYLSQGCRWPARSEQREHLDAVYRNRGNGTFQNVTSQAGIEEWGFSQGVAVGDVNQDGFADLYVGNIGDNRLFLNNGDGTFHDVTQSAGLGQSNVWTSSPMLADFNNDSLPDLYVTTYLQGADLYTRDCGRDGHLQQCDPKFFDAAPDRIFRNRGDGSFIDETETSGIVAAGGKGLGVVGVDLEGRGLPDIFVANDLTANFQFHNQSEAGGNLRFVETGVLNGFAFNGDGLPQASMGIAAGDADEDGRQDLLVTNFLDEGSTLYLQQADLAFVDQTRRAGLLEKSRTRLSFGAQFLDGDLDGRLDLVVASGHIYDFAYQGLPYRMPLDYFHNGGAGQFRFIPPETVGASFQEETLGRALTTLDWNRDGLPDFAVSYLDRPCGVYENVTADAGHRIAIRLIGTQSNRDGYFAQIVARTGNRTWSRQLTAGDGYQSSNERCIILGIGESKEVETLEVRWPAGTRQAFQHILADHEFLIIEGREQPVMVRHHMRTEP